MNTHEPPDPERRLVYRFFTLPFAEQLAVIVSMRLVVEDDHRLSYGDLGRAIIARAKERKLLARLWDEVERRHPNPSNPFREGL